MTISLPLESMSIEEKKRVMELIWNDLCRDNDLIASPKWHEDVLKNSEGKVSSREDSYVDWELAKKQLRSEVE